jgi:5-oxoprolinase (ATP-hydrolysing) subunit A
VPTIDLNADVGEECGDDAALLAIVTTASVATGAHAGGGAVLERTVQLAVRSGVVVGAHPSYPDRVGFGRTSRAAEHGPDGVAVLVREQVVTVARTCTEHGTCLSHVKAHGALYADVAGDPDLARAFLSGVEQAGRDVDAEPFAVMGLPGTMLSRLCVENGVPFLAESFADRAYAPDGSLVPRSVPGSVIDDPDAVAARALSLAVDGGVHAVDGTWVEVPAVTVCVHGDTPGAVALARRVRVALEDHGVRIAPARPQA